MANLELFVVFGKKQKFFRSLPASKFYDFQAKTVFEELH